MTSRIQKLEELLAEAYADADEVLRPRIKHLESQLAEEREACAKVCDELHHKWNWGNDEPVSGPSECAAAIRARSKEK